MRFVPYIVSSRRRLRRRGCPHVRLTLYMCLVSWLYKWLRPRLARGKKKKQSKHVFGCFSYILKRTYFKGFHLPDKSSCVDNSYLGEERLCFFSIYLAQRKTEWVCMRSDLVSGTARNVSLLRCFRTSTGRRYSTPEPSCSEPTFTPSAHHHTSRS